MKVELVKRADAESMLKMEGLQLVERSLAAGTCHIRSVDGNVVFCAGSVLAIYYSSGELRVFVYDGVAADHSYIKNRQFPIEHKRKPEPKKALGDKPPKSNLPVPTKGDKDKASPDKERPLKICLLDTETRSLIPIPVSQICRNDRFIQGRQIGKDEGKAEEPLPPRRHLSVPIRSYRRQELDTPNRGSAGRNQETDGRQNRHHRRSDRPRRQDVEKSVKVTKMDAILQAASVITAHMPKIGAETETEANLSDGESRKESINVPGSPKDPNPIWSMASGK